MAQRTLACTACHGKEGRAAPDGYYPRIAGKPAGYLYNQLLNFRDGRRHYGLMTRLLDPCPTPTCWRSRSTSRRWTCPTRAPHARRRAAPPCWNAAESLALQGRCERPSVPACAQCHGAALTGVAPNTPGLLGLAARLPQRPTGRLEHRAASCACAGLHGADRAATASRRTSPLSPAGWRPNRCRPKRKPAPALPRAARHHLRQRDPAGRQAAAMKRLLLGAMLVGVLARRRAGAGPELQAARTASTTRRRSRRRQATRSRAAPTWRAPAIA